jgi:diketogulonate reductase-like aldo/keto reductase
VALRWHVERDVVPIPSTTDPAHVVENLDVFGFELDDDELARLDGLRDPEFSR